MRFYTPSPLPLSPARFGCGEPAVNSGDKSENAAQRGSPQFFILLPPPAPDLIRADISRVVSQLPARGRRN